MAATFGRPLPTSQQKRAVVRTYNEATIRAVETSANTGIEEAAKEWIEAVAKSNMAGVAQAAAMMAAACHQAGVMSFES
jgi:hypothetical protein